MAGIHLKEDSAVAAVNKAVQDFMNNGNVAAIPALRSNTGQYSTNAAGVTTFSGGSIARPLTPQRAVLAGLDMGDKYDIQYNQDYIRDLLDTATAAEYNSKRQEFAATENKFYNELYDTQASALDAIRASNSAAVATGATKGMAAAQQLAAVLGLEQASVESATDLANQRNELAAQEAAAYAKNANTALDTSNALKQAISEAALNKYGYDTQSYVGELDYNAALQAVIGEIMQSANSAAATMYNADRNLEGTKYAADQNGRYSGGYTGGYTGGNGTGGNGTGTGTDSNKSNSSGSSWDNGGVSEANIRTMQRFLGVGDDGKWGDKSRAAAKDKWGTTDPAEALKKYQAANTLADQKDQGNSSSAVKSGTYNGKSYTYNSTTGVYMYDNKPYYSFTSLKSAIDTIDAMTGAAPPVPDRKRWANIH